MRKILFSLLALICFACLLNAETLYYDVAMQGKDFISNATKLDTLAATDSTTLKSSWNPANGWQHFITWDAFTGTGSDSVAVDVLLDSYSPSGTLLYRTHVDTLTSASGGILALPIGTLAAGYSYGLKLMTIAGAGTQLILNRFYLGMRK